MMPYRNPGPHSGMKNSGNGKFVCKYVIGLPTFKGCSTDECLKQK